MPFVISLPKLLLPLRLAVKLGFTTGNHIDPIRNRQVLSLQIAQSNSLE